MTCFFRIHRLQDDVAQNRVKLVDVVVRTLIIVLKVLKEKHVYV